MGPKELWIPSCHSLRNRPTKPKHWRSCRERLVLKPPPLTTRSVANSSPKETGGIHGKELNKIIHNPFNNKKSELIARSQFTQ